MPDPKEERPLGETQVEFEFTSATGGEPAVDPLDFAEYLTALVRALRLITDFVAHEKTGVDYELVSLNYNSPLNVVVEAKHVPNEEVFALSTAYFTSTIDSLQQGGEPPIDMGWPVLQALYRVAEASKRSRLAAAVRTRTHRTTVQPRLSDTLTVYVEDDVEVEGTFEGMVQVLNVRGKPRIRIFPHAGPFVTCRVPRALLGKAKAAVDEYVVVEGTLIYRPNEVHPRRIRVKEIHPVERTDDTPSFDDLWGAGAGYRPEVSSLDLIEEMRSGWR